MLKGLDPLLGPELLAMLRAMGHGDEIAIVDGNYPAQAHGRRVVRADGQGGDPAAAWTGFDLGVSWRTPWRGELSFGAENLISRGDINALPDVPPTTEADQSAARTPYVRYKQDL